MRRSAVAAARYDEESQFYEFNKAAWEQALQRLKQVLESRRV